MNKETPLTNSMTPGSTTVKRNIQFWCWAFPFVIDWRWFTTVAEVVQGRRRNRGQLEAKNACPQRKICKRKMERPRPIAPRNKIATKSPRLAAKRGVFRGAHRHSTQPSQERERAVAVDGGRYMAWRGTWQDLEGERARSQDGQSATHLVYKESESRRGGELSIADERVESGGSVLLESQSPLLRRGRGCREEFFEELSATFAEGEANSELFCSNTI
jgi:hypothetical protein